MKMDNGMQLNGNHTKLKLPSFAESFGQLMPDLQPHPDMYDTTMWNLLPPVLDNDYTSESSSGPCMASSSRALSTESLGQCSQLSYTSQHGERRSASQRPYGQPHKSSRIKKRTNVEKTDNKKLKEKRSRDEQGAVLWRCEDVLKVLIGFEPDSARTQTAGNGTGAGLCTPKIDILRAMEMLTNWFLQRDYDEAFANQCLAEWQAQMRSLVESAPSAPPYARTDLECTWDDLCSHENSKSKPCTKHGRPDWRICRNLEVQTRFNNRKVRHFASTVPDTTARPSLPARPARRSQL